MEQEPLEQLNEDPQLSDPTDLTASSQSTQDSQPISDHDAEYRSPSSVRMDLDTPEGQLAPPEGIFMWHYVQCVLGRFATPRFKAFANIRHMDDPTRRKRVSDDSSGPDTPNDYAPYPGFIFDASHEEAEQEQMRNARLDIFRRHAAKDD
jgi:hypothetical protein